MSIAQKLQRRATAIRAARTDASANQPAENITTVDSAANIAGDVAPWVSQDRAAIGGGIEDYRSPKPAPIQGPNGSY